MAGRSLRQRATAVVIRDGKVLLVRERGARRYSLPGGGVKKREPVVCAAARELYEELSLEATQVTRMPRFDFTGSVNEHQVCLVEVKGEPILRRLEINSFLWWDRNEPIPVRPHVEGVLGKMKHI